MDVDGTLTDGKLYIGSNGEVMKAFNVKDGMLISSLEKYDVIPVVITGRQSVITARRCEELGITEVHQGVKDKISQLTKIAEKYNCRLDNIAYIGDDINDLECLQICGISGCPADAVREVKAAVDYICQNNGGYGAVREFIEYIITVT